jgi:branched-chain amino acid transport system permease protein
MTAGALTLQAPLVARHWGAIVRIGLLGGVVGIYLALVGIVPRFDGRPLVEGFISMGQTALVATAVGSGLLAARRGPRTSAAAAIAGGVAGGVAGALLAALVVLGAVVDVRAVMLNASPELWKVLTLGNGVAGFWAPIVYMAAFGALAGALYGAPRHVRMPIALGLFALVLGGLFAALLRGPLVAGDLWQLANVLFSPNDGLTPLGAGFAFVVASGGYLLQQRSGVRQRVAALPARSQRRLRISTGALGVLAVLLLPQVLGSQWAFVIAFVALYVLMGMGLNITLGLAGLLDLGFVAFFAVGAYTVGLLTSTAEFGIAGWSWWMAVPFAVIFAMIFGALLGLPILRIRGDYLAIATLGFGEIIRILAGSDLLKPFLGGPRGVINIPAPIEVAPDHFLAGPNQIYYIAIASAILVAFVAVRLRSSRLGRAWVAIREDEDVAEAMGINLVHTKMLAYMLGAAFAGLGGAVFAGLNGAMISSSITLLISINIVAIVIVGGMGSIPGVVIGAVVLIGIPELFREFSEYRFLFYGAALIAMMQFRPGGLLPSAIVRRELESHDTPGADGVAEGGLAAAPAGR